MGTSGQEENLGAGGEGGGGEPGSETFRRFCFVREGVEVARRRGQSVGLCMYFRGRGGRWRRRRGEGPLNPKKNCGGGGSGVGGTAGESQGSIYLKEGGGSQGGGGVVEDCRVAVVEEGEDGGRKAETRE